MDPDLDPGGPKTCESCGSGSVSPTLVSILNTTTHSYLTVPYLTCFLQLYKINRNIFLHPVAYFIFYLGSVK
jgi:hypothetical protein